MLTEPRSRVCKSLFKKKLNGNKDPKINGYKRYKNTKFFMGWHALAKITNLVQSLESNGCIECSGRIVSTSSKKLSIFFFHV